MNPSTLDLIKEHMPKVYEVIENQLPLDEEDEKRIESIIEEAKESKHPKSLWLAKGDIENGIFMEKYVKRYKKSKKLAAKEEKNKIIEKILKNRNVELPNFFTSLLKTEKDGVLNHYLNKAIEYGIIEQQRENVTEEGIYNWDFWVKEDVFGKFDLLSENEKMRNHVYYYAIPRNTERLLGRLFFSESGREIWISTGYPFFYIKNFKYIDAKASRKTSVNRFDLKALDRMLCELFEVCQEIEEKHKNDGSKCDDYISYVDNNFDSFAKLNSLKTVIPDITEEFKKEVQIEMELKEKEIDEKCDIASKKVFKKAKFLGGDLLKGSPRQRLIGEELREVFLNKVSDSAIVYYVLNHPSCQEAKFWRENRSKIFKAPNVRYKKVTKDDVEINEIFLKSKADDFYKKNEGK